MDEKAFTEVQVSRGEVPACHWQEEKKSGHRRVGKRSLAITTSPHKEPTRFHSSEKKQVRDPSHGEE